MNPSVDQVAIQTHYLVIATFVLACITTLAIIAPIITAWIAAVNRRKKLRIELFAIVFILKERVDAITATTQPGYNIGAGVSALCSRVFSGEMASALVNGETHPVYSAVASATDAILSYAGLLQEYAEPLTGSPGQTIEESRRAALYLRRRALIVDAARDASMSLAKLFPTIASNTRKNRLRSFWEGFSNRLQRKP